MSDHFAPKSLEPVEEQDRQETIKLLNSYISGRYNTEYGFSRLDIKNLISPEDVIKSSIKETEHIQTDHIYTQTDQTNNEPKNQCRKNKLDLKPQSCQEMNYPSMKCTKETKKNKQKTEQQEKDKNGKDSVLKAIPTKETKIKSFHPDRFLFVKGKVKFEECEDGSIQCGGCKEMFKRILAHLNKSKNCSKHIDLDEFKVIWSKFTGRKKVAKHRQKQRDEDSEKFLKDNAERQKKFDQKLI